MKPTILAANPFYKFLCKRLCFANSKIFPNILVPWINSFLVEIYLGFKKKHFYLFKQIFHPYITSKQHSRYSILLFVICTPKSYAFVIIAIVRILYLISSIMLIYLLVKVFIWYYKLRSKRNVICLWRWFVYNWKMLFIKLIMK